MEVFVYIRTGAGKALEALEAIKGLEGVKEVYAVTGRFDIVARVEAADLKALGETVIKKIQGVEGVTRTETAVIIA